VRAHATARGESDNGEEEWRPQPDEAGKEVAVGENLCGGRRGGRARQCSANLGIRRGSEGWRDVREVASESRGRGHGACGRPHCILMM
jgi:hypothetical protein